MTLKNFGWQIIRPDKTWGDSEAKNKETFEDSDKYYSQMELGMILTNDMDETWDGSD